MPNLDTHVSYDDVPYEGGIVTGTHPEHLRAIARLFGIDSAPAERCRVLEIGCASATNLLPMSYALPGSTFVGIDPSARQIAMGKSAVAAYGVENIELLALDVRDIVNWDREFDYIVCHGVFSWVPDDVREAILEASRNLLAPNGVALISYNVLPGFHARAPVREMMRFHSWAFQETRERAHQARALLKFLMDATARFGDTAPGLAAYATFLKEEGEIVVSSPDSYLLHEHLAEHNVPFYLHEFVDLAGEHGLQYLGDTAFWTMMLNTLSPETSEQINAIAQTQVALEQYRDFVVNRTFRKTLLCRADTPVERHISVERIASLSFRERISRGATADWRISSVGGKRMKVSDPNVQRVLEALEQAAPSSLTFEELKRLSAGESRPAESDEPLAAILLSLYSLDAVDFRTWTPPMSTEIGERPTVFEPARRTANKPHGSTPVPLHAFADLDPFVESVLPFADGTRTVEEIIADVNASIAAGAFEIFDVEQDDMPDPAEVPRLVRESLEHIRRCGLLLPS